MRMRGERVAQVGDPGRAGRPLHRRAEEVERRRRRGREHDVDPLAPDEPDRDRRRERAPGDVLVRHEQPAPEQRGLRAEPRDSLLGDELLGRDGRRAARRSARDGSTPASAARAPRPPGRRREVRREHVRLDPERREVRRELQRPLDAAAAARREVARHEQDLQLCPSHAGKSRLEDDEPAVLVAGRRPSRSMRSDRAGAGEDEPLRSPSQRLLEARMREEPEHRPPRAWRARSAACSRRGSAARRRRRPERTP